MARNFSHSERYIKELFCKGTTFTNNNKHYEVILSDKPTCSKGEPKTDLYILVTELETNTRKELKISVKKSNADFLENKISDERALAIFGQDWKYIINACTMQLEDKFKSKPLTELYTTAQDVINNIIPITTYVESHPDIYLACKALNYRTFEQKFDGDRPLCVFVDWDVKNRKLTPNVRFDAPLVTCGNAVASKLLNAMKTLSITTTDNITPQNVASSDFVY